VFDGPTPPLTGPEALDPSDVAAVAAVASDLPGRTTRRVVVPGDRYRAELLEQGLAEHAVAAFLQATPTPP
jgi:NAD(P)H dehydrogenase (quinone)